MPRVPTIGQIVGDLRRPRGADPAFQTGRGVSPEAFGAGTARGLATFGQAITGVGDVAAKIYLEDVARRAKNLDTQFSEHLDLLLYGDGTDNNPGFYNLQGEHALSAFEPTREAIASLQTQIAESEEDQRVRTIFSREAAAKASKELSTMSRFRERERRTANDAASEARITRSIEEAARAWNDPERLSRSLGIARSEVVEMGQRNGWSPEVISHEISRTQSKVLESTVSAALERDFGRAVSIYTEHQEMIDGNVQAKMERAFDAKNRQMLADQEREERRAERAYRDAQDDRFANLIVAGARGELDEVSLVDALDNRLIRPEQFQTALKFMRSEQEEGGDKEAELEWKLRIFNNDASMAEIAADPRLDLDQKGKLIDSFAAEVRRDGMFAQGPVEAQERRLKNFVGAIPGPFGALDMQAVMREANAIQDFRDRVEAEGPQNAREIVDELIELYRPVPENPQSLPRSAYWPSTGPNPFGGTQQEMRVQLSEAYTQLQRDNREGNIDQQRYLRELMRLSEISEFIGRMQQ